MQFCIKIGLNYIPRPASGTTQPPFISTAERCPQCKTDTRPPLGFHSFCNTPCTEPVHKVLSILPARGNPYQPLSQLESSTYVPTSTSSHLHATSQSFVPSKRTSHRYASPSRCYIREIYISRFAISTLLLHIYLPGSTYLCCYIGTSYILIYTPCVLYMLPNIPEILGFPVSIYLHLYQYLYPYYFTPFIYCQLLL